MHYLEPTLLQLDTTDSLSGSEPLQPVTTNSWLTSSVCLRVDSERYCQPGLQSNVGSSTIFLFLQLYALFDTRPSRIMGSSLSRVAKRSSRLARSCSGTDLRVDITRGGEVFSHRPPNGAHCALLPQGSPAGVLLPSQPGESEGSDLAEAQNCFWEYSR